MGRKKKDFRPLNIRLDRSIHDQLDAYCEIAGQTKTVAVERAVMMYLQAYQKSDTERTDANG